MITNNLLHSAFPLLHIFRACFSLFVSGSENIIEDSIAKMEDIARRCPDGTPYAWVLAKMSLYSYTIDSWYILYTSSSFPSKNWQELWAVSIRLGT